MLLLKLYGELLWKVIFLIENNNMIQAKEKYSDCQWEYQHSLKILEMF